MKLSIEYLNNLEDAITNAKSEKRKCIIENIIEQYPETHRAQVRNILENKKEYSGVAALRIIRNTGMMEGGASSISKHRTHYCMCYL